MGEMKVRPVKPRVQLIGMNGNAFAILGRVERALRDAGRSREEVERFHKEATAGDYDNLLRVVSEYVEIY